MLEMIARAIEKLVKEGPLSLLRELLELAVALAFAGLVAGSIYLFGETIGIAVAFVVFIVGILLKNAIW